jgi:TatD DNase family protein
MAMYGLYDVANVYGELLMATEIQEKIMLFDSHCHFDFDAFSSCREKLWQECIASGVQQLLIPGIKPKQWPVGIKIAQKYDGIFMSCGLHPWFIDANVEQLPTDEQWRVVLASPHCVAIGECGLDAAITTPLQIQIPIFERHLVLAQQLAMPVIIHVRNTHNETIRLLKKYRLEKGGVIHGFTGSKELAAEYWKMGFYLGVGGSITYPRAKKTREAIQSMPIESLLLETDAPDMPPLGHQGQANSPLHLLLIANALAELKAVSVVHIAHMTTKSSRLLFGV